jgi:hypothetical protein
MSSMGSIPIGLPQTGEVAGPRMPGRQGRVLVLLPIIWALNLLDLLFTLLAGTTRDFIELNPLAARLGAPGQMVFKLAMLTFCTVIFVMLRRRRSVELGCYLLLSVYGLLAVIWLTMFPFLLSPIYLRQLAGLF